MRYQRVAAPCRLSPEPTLTPLPQYCTFPRSADSIHLSAFSERSKQCRCVTCNATLTLHMTFFAFPGPRPAILTMPLPVHPKLSPRSAVPCRYTTFLINTEALPRIMPSRFNSIPCQNPSFPHKTFPLPRYVTQRRCSSSCEVHRRHSASLHHARTIPLLTLPERSTTFPCHHLTRLYRSVAKLCSATTEHLRAGPLQRTTFLLHCLTGPTVHNVSVPLHISTSPYRNRAV